MKASQYKILVHATIPALNADVTSHLRDGWALYGNPIIDISIDGDPLWCNFAQAVIKLPEESVQTHSPISA